MDFSELVTHRGSIRGYKSDPIEEEKLLAVLEAARMAPTAHNNQPFRLVVIHTEGREEELSQIYGQPWFTQPPIVICIVGVPSEGWVRHDGKNYYEVDVAIAMDHLILAAHNLGLGYPDKEPREKVRKSLDELVQYEKWE